MKRYYNSTENKWYIEGDRITVKRSGMLFSGVRNIEEMVAS